MQILFQQYSNIDFYKVNLKTRTKNKHFTSPANFTTVNIIQLIPLYSGMHFKASLYVDY